MHYHEEDMYDLRFRINFIERRIDKINDKLSNASQGTILSLIATVMNLDALKERVSDIEDQVYRSDLKNRSFRKRKPNLVRGKIRTKNLKLRNNTNQ